MLSNRNELQSIKDNLDAIPVNTDYFKDIDNGYETFEDFQDDMLNMTAANIFGE